MNPLKNALLNYYIQNEQEKERRSLPPFTEKKIALRIYELNGICSLYILYYFMHIHEYSQMENFTKIKNKELMKLKKMIENYKKYNNIMAHNSNDN